MRIALRYVLAAALAAVSLADIILRSRGLLFFPDEIHNLDPILQFFRRLDYTSASQGGHPFDPVLSSGILATWLNGAVFVAGADLFVARAVTALVQFALAVALAFVFLRGRGVARADAWVISLGAWAAFIPVGSHYLRFMNAGELWGFLYIAAGCFFLARRPMLAAFVWGLGTWLAKIIYLPFAAALLAAVALAHALQSGERSSFAGRVLAAGVRLGLAFAAPLLAWMALILLRYDAAVLGRWIASYVTFVAKHAAEVQVTGLPVYEGWRFDPDWNAMPLLSDWRWAAAYLAPVALAAAAVAAYGVVRRGGRMRTMLTETLMLAATCAALVVTVAWFFLFDPTQWGRHLMPAVYVAAAVALYCGVEIYRTFPPAHPAARALAVLAYALVLTGGARSVVVTRAYAAAEGWKLSYATTCAGSLDVDVLSPPCHNGDAMELLEALAKQWCGPDTQVFSPADECKVKNRRRVLEHAVGMLADPATRDRAAHTARYLIVLIQSYDYQTPESFDADFLPLVCGRAPEPLRERLEPLGFDTEHWAVECRRFGGGQRLRKRAT